MKVLFINSSPRKNGVTSTILEGIRSNLHDCHQVSWINMTGTSIKPCIGCLKCRPDKKCVQSRDDAHRIGELIKESDILIIGSPCYWGNMSGELKILFDRNVTTFEYADVGIPKPVLSGKKAILVIASNAPFPFNLIKSQSQGAVNSILNILKAGGIQTIGIINVPNTRMFDKNSKKWLKKATTMAHKINLLF